MSKLEALMKKKQGESELSPMHKEAKMGVLKDLHEMASKLMKGNLDGHLEGMKKVTVASPDKEGLALGLEKAKEMMSNPAKDAGDEESHEDPLEEKSESPEVEASEEAQSGEEMRHELPREKAAVSHDDIDKQIEELKKKKALLLMSGK